MSHLTKVKLVLFIAGLLMAGASQIYVKGIDAGLVMSDQEAFDSYVQFAKPLQHEQSRMRREAKHTQSKPAAHSVWAALVGEK